MNSVLRYNACFKYIEKAVLNEHFLLEHLLCSKKDYFFVFFKKKYVCDYYMQSFSALSKNKPEKQKTVNICVHIYVNICVYSQCVHIYEYVHIYECIHIFYEAKSLGIFSW